MENNKKPLIEIYDKGNGNIRFDSKCADGDAAHMVLSAYVGLMLQHNISDEVIKKSIKSALEMARGK